MAGRGAPRRVSVAADPLVDYAGVSHRPVGDEARIVSLVPSITELLFDLGLGGQVVGRTHYCVHPRPEVDLVPSVGGTKKVAMERLVALAPTHVVANVDENSREQVAAIAALGPAVVVTHPIAVDDNLALYRLLGGIFGREQAAEALCVALGAEIAATASLAARLPARNVLYLIWKAPWMTVSRDTYISRLLARVNWTTMAHDPLVRYPEVDLAHGPPDGCDLVLFPSEPYRFTDADVAAFGAAHPGGAARLLPVDGEMLSWYGSRAVAGLAYLRALAAPPD